MQSWQCAAARDDIKPGEMLGVRVGDAQIVLVEFDGELRALGDVCPHAYALLSQGYLEGGEIECPLHAARFDIRTGRCLEGPTTDPVAVYDVKVDGDAVFVRKRG